MVKVKMIMGARVSEDRLADAGEVVEVSPGAARILIGSNKAIAVLDGDDAPAPGVLTARDPEVENRDPKSAKRK